MGSVRGTHASARLTNVVERLLLLRVVRCLPPQQCTGRVAQVQRAGVGQAPRDETAGRRQGISVCRNTMGILMIPGVWRSTIILLFSS